MYGFVFFGVPNDGMKVEHLIAMVGDNRNRFLVESISSNNPAITSEMSRNFPVALGAKDSAGGDTEVICFYEDRESPVPEEVHQLSWPPTFSFTWPSGLEIKFYKKTWRMSEHKRTFLVQKSSATRYSSRWDDGVEHICGIARTHSDMVKFSRHDDEYKNVRVRLKGIAKRARLREPRIDGMLHVHLSAHGRLPQNNQTLLTDFLVVF